MRIEHEIDNDDDDGVRMVSLCREHSLQMYPSPLMSFSSLDVLHAPALAVGFLVLMYLIDNLFEQFSKIFLKYQFALAFADNASSENSINLASLMKSSGFLP